MPLFRRALLLAGLTIALASAWFAPLDSRAEQYLEAGLKRALVSFAAARALNAVISVAQGTEVAAQPGGVGVIFSVGQVLDPINDLVEQFSALMLGASVAFAVELALLKMGSYWAVSLALSAAALAWGWFYWRSQTAPTWLIRVLVGFLLVRFAVPIVALGSEAGFQLFLAEDYADGQARIELSTSQLGGAAKPAATPEPPEGIADRIKRWWSQSTDIGKRFEELKDIAARTVEHIVKLIVVFLLQTLVLPTLLLWALLRIGRALVAGGRPT